MCTKIPYGFKNLVKLGSVSKNFKITISRTFFGFEVEKYFFSFPAISALFFWKKHLFLKCHSLAHSVKKPLKVPSLARSVPKPLNQLSRRWVAKLMKPAS